MAIQKNKYARRATEQRERQRSTITRDTPPSIDDQLARLEDDIRKLKIEFDVYFNGASKRPPYDTKGRVETMIKRLGDERSLSFAQRYLYNTLVARYTAFRELWRRTMQGREEGRDALSAARIAARAQLHEPERTSEPSIFVCADAHKDVPTVKQIYDTLVEAKKRCGESVDDFSFPRFHRMIAAKAETLKERLGCERVRFSVDIEAGRVSFKAKAEK